jgi:hypothetical protein
MTTKTRASIPPTTRPPISVELSIDQLLDQLERRGVRFIRVATDGAHDIQLVRGKTQLLAALHRRSR